MLTVFFGNDVTRVRQKAFVFLQSITETDALVTKVTLDTYQEGMLPDLSQGASLFGTAQVVLIDTPSEDALFFADVLDNLSVMKDSGSHFIMIEGPLNASDKKKIGTHATKVDEVSEAKREKFNAFLLTDALLRKDKKSLWLLLMQAWGEGLTNEEIMGVLSWQIKVLRLVEKTKNAEEAGQKPFVYQKAKRALSNFKKGELDDLSRSLIRVYHDGHLGKHDAKTALEKWVLTL